MNVENIYKLYINIFPFIRGVIYRCLYRLVRSCITFGSLTRIKKSVDFRFFPGCIADFGKSLIVGKNSTISVARGASLIIGKNVGIGNKCEIICHKHIEIGDDTILAPGVMMFDHNHTFDLQTGVDQRSFENGKIVIGKRCWIGAAVIVLNNVTIGDNCVIGAGSIVTKDITSGSVAVGNPARVINKI